MVLVSALPLLLVESTRGAPDEEPHGLWQVVRLAPVVMLANVVYAASVESMITFFPLFGLELGLSQEFSLGLLTVLAIGGMILVLPLGWLADRIDRMAMLAVVTALTIVGLLLLPAMVQAPPVLASSFVFVLGGVEGMIYALGVMLIGQQFRGASLAAASTAFTTCWGVGTVLGPLLSGVGMDRLGAGSLTWVAAAFFVLFLPLPVRAWWLARPARPG
jgi:MFS family permease